MRSIDSSKRDYLSGERLAIPPPALPYLMGQPHFDDLPWLMAGALRGWPLWAASLGGAFSGALIGGGSLWLMGWTWEKLRGIEARVGDVKMS